LEAAVVTLLHVIFIFVLSAAAIPVKHTKPGAA
jgi:hypothetical protein